MKNIIITIFLAISVNAFSQTSVDSVLANIERNNTTLFAYRRNIEAEKIGNKTGITPSNPEIEFGYLWGNPYAIGNRTDLSIRQSFDFPTAYAYRSQISNLKNEQAELEYQRQRREILLQARLLCAELTYQNAMLAEYNKRMNSARQIADIYKKKFDAGETNVLEYNKSQVHLLNLSKDLQNIEIQRQTLFTELSRLNGGKTIEFADSIFGSPQLMPDFEQWYAQTEQKNPVLQWLKQESAITKKQAQLQVAENLPKLSAGYMSEKVVGQQFRGVTLGMTIPLWENKNTVKYSRAKAIAAESLQSDSKLQFYNQMKTRYAKALALQTSTNSYRLELKKFSNRELLAKALDKGEISLGEYLIELSIYYESINKLLEMERSMFIAYYELVMFQ